MSGAAPGTARGARYPGGLAPSVGGFHRSLRALPRQVTATIRTI